MSKPSDIGFKGSKNTWHMSTVIFGNDPWQVFIYSKPLEATECKGREFYGEKILPSV